LQNNRAEISWAKQIIGEVTDWRSSSIGK
jgi:hypothetical protein